MIYRFFKLPVQHGYGYLEYTPMSKDHMKRLRSIWDNVQLFIIDEGSMMSNEVELMIHRRLDDMLVDDLDLAQELGIVVF